MCEKHDQRFHYLDNCPNCMSEENMNDKEFIQATTLTDEEKERIKNAINYPNGKPLKGESEIDYKNRWINDLNAKILKLQDEAFVRIENNVQLGRELDREKLRNQKLEDHVSFHHELRLKELALLNEANAKLSEYTKACDNLHEKLKIAVSAFKEITENCCFDEGHKMSYIAHETLKKLPKYQDEGTQDKDAK
jgi:hypothetical protein